MPASHLVCTCGNKAHGVHPIISCEMLLEDWRLTVEPLIQWMTLASCDGAFMSLGTHSVILLGLSTGKKSQLKFFCHLSYELP